MAVDNKVQLIIEALDKSKPAMQGIIKSIDDIRNRFTLAQGGVDGFMGAITSKGAIAGAALTAIAAALTSTIAKTAEHGDTLLKYSEQTGMSVEALSKIEQFAAVAETDLEKVTQAVGKFSKELHSASHGPFANAIKAIGLNIKELRDMRPEDALQKISEKFEGLKDGSAKTALAMELFGKSGKDIIPFLNKFNSEIGKFNSMFTREQAEAADQFNDNITKLKTNIQRLTVAIGNELIPAVNELFARLSGDASKGQLDALDKRINYLFSQLSRPKHLNLVDEPKLKAELEKLIKQRDEMQKKLADENRQKYPAADSQKESPKPIDTTALAEARQALDSRLKLMLSGVNESRTVLLESIKTQEKTLDEQYKRGIIGEQQYQAEKLALQKTALEATIQYAQIESEAVQNIGSQKLKYFDNEKDKLAEQSSTKEELSKRSIDIAKAEQEITRLGIDDKIKTIEYSKRLTETQKEGELKILEARLAIEKELRDIRLDNQNITPTQAVQADIDAERQRLTLQKELLQVKLQNADSDAAKAAILNEIESITLRLNNTESENLKLAEARRQTIALEKDRAIYITEQALSMAQLNGETQRAVELEQRLIKLKNDRELLEKGLTEEQKTASKTRAEAEIAELEAMKDPYTALQKGMNDLVTKWQDTGKVMYSIGRDTAQALQSSFSDLFFDAMQGKIQSLGSYLKSFLAALQRQVANMLAQMVTGGSSGGGIGGLIGLIPSIVGLFSGTGTTGTSPAPNGTITVHSGGLIMHSGGLVPRLHWGGLAPDERPAILQSGEYVVSRRGVAALDRINSGVVSADNGSQEVHNHYYIQAVDAKSFADLVERNPGSIKKIVSDDLRRNSTLRSSIRSAM